MATNKPRFRLTTYGKLNHGDLVYETHWVIRHSLKIKAIEGKRNDPFLVIQFTDGTWIIRRPTDKCLASW